MLYNLTPTSDTGGIGALDFLLPFITNSEPMSIDSNFQGSFVFCHGYSSFCKQDSKGKLFTLFGTLNSQIIAILGNLFLKGLASFVHTISQPCSIYQFYQPNPTFKFSIHYISSKIKIPIIVPQVAVLLNRFYF